MAADFTPNSIKKSGGGGAEGGTTPLPPPEDIQEKIIVEDIRIEPISEKISQGEEEMEDTIPEMPADTQEPVEEIKPIDETPEPFELEDALEVIPEPTQPVFETLIDPEPLDEYYKKNIHQTLINGFLEGESKEIFDQMNQPTATIVSKKAHDQLSSDLSPEPENESSILPSEKVESQLNEVGELLKLKFGDSDDSQKIVPESKSKKKRKATYEPAEYTNVFSRVWNGFFDLFEFKSHREKAFTKSFVSVAIMISLISMFHVQGLFALVNPFWLSWVVALAIEIAVIVSLFSLKMLDRVSSWMIWMLIFILFLLQAVGNTFSAFIALDMQNGLISQLIDMVNIFGIAKDSIWLKRVISFLLGGVLPLLAFLFIKSISEYLDNSEEDEFYEEE